MMKKILFFGDSLTAGYGLNNATGESLPALIQEKINREKLRFKVINGGLSGDTSAGGLTRIEYFLNQHIDVFVLELGANDMLRNFDANCLDHNLRSILAKVRSTFPGIQIILLGMELPIWLIGENDFPFKNIYAKIAADLNISLVPFILDGVAGVPHLNMSDGFHPSAAGYQIVANTIWPTLRKLL